MCLMVWYGMLQEYEFDEDISFISQSILLQFMEKEAENRKSAHILRRRKSMEPSNSSWSRSSEDVVPAPVSASSKNSSVTFNLMPSSMSTSSSIDNSVPNDSNDVGSSNDNVQIHSNASSVIDLLTSPDMGVKRRSFKPSAQLEQYLSTRKEDLNLLLSRQLSSSSSFINSNPFLRPHSASFFSRSDSSSRPGSSFFSHKKTGSMTSDGEESNSPIVNVSLRDISFELQRTDSKFDLVRTRTETGGSEILSDRGKDEDPVAITVVDEPVAITSIEDENIMCMPSIDLLKERSHLYSRIIVKTLDSIAGMYAK